MVPSHSMNEVRLRVHLQGMVQGVGFRPFVHRLARKWRLNGWVRNATDGVILEVEGPGDHIAAFVKEVQTRKPPAAFIDSLETDPVPVRGEPGFRLLASVIRPGEFVLVSPDLATCDPCLAETVAPENRRHRYPFTNCTNCGPRFTVIRALPYDRPRTTMGAFGMCDECRREYEDLTDRRYHAQPNACPHCGPQLWVEPQEPDTTGDALSVTARWLDEGRIVAIKGLGGFHLACDATNEETVDTLRRRKRRPSKPFALMVGDLSAIEALCFVSSSERELLTSPRRPIVLLRRKPDIPVAPGVAPRSGDLGVMLPYTPLHALLLREVGTPALVMTSGNRADEPLCVANDEASARLAAVADGFLFHDRPIHVRCDDSVTAVLTQPESLGDNRETDRRQMSLPPVELVVRRARGYAPHPIRTEVALPQVIASGSHLKSTFCFARERYLFVSQHLGDLDTPKAADCYREALRHFQRLFQFTPVALARDLHPDYMSTRLARQEWRLPEIPVQHHHAHLAGVMAEHGLTGPLLGIAFDGVGLGPEGTLWGGEFLLCTACDYRRVGHFRHVPQPGGDAAAREPWRMALAHWLDAVGEWNAPLPPFLASRWQAFPVDLVRQMLGHGVSVPLTSSVGRLCDAVASLVGVRDRNEYEGQAAVELEACAEVDCAPAHPLPIADGKPFVLDTRPLIAAVLAEVRAGRDRGEVAGRFHASLAVGVVQACVHCRRQFLLKQVALSGGVFQNRLLLRHLLPRLTAAGFEVFLPRHVPCNDGGLAVGQAFVAASRVAEGLAEPNGE